MHQPAPETFENRASRMRQHADLSHCLALAAELRGDGCNAARLTLDGMLLDARAARLTHTPFDAVLGDAFDAHIFQEHRA